MLRPALMVCSQSFYHYSKVMDRAVARSKEPVLEVGVVYLLGAIGEVGEYDAGSVGQLIRIFT